LLPELFSVKVKVLGGGFGLWLGDDIAILSMVKRAHLLFLTRYASGVDMRLQGVQWTGRAHLVVVLVWDLPWFPGAAGSRVLWF
jgi:hypothetical protein